MKYRKALLITCAILLALQGCIGNNPEEETEKSPSNLSNKEYDTQMKGNSDLVLKKYSHELQVGFLGNVSDLGRVTFSKNHRAIFYYDRKTNSGEVKLNDTIYKLNKEVEVLYKYKFTGRNLEITTTEFKYEETEGGDCIYGTVSQVNIKLNGKSVTLKDISVQDCPTF